MIKSIIQWFQKASCKHQWATHASREGSDIIFRVGSKGYVETIKDKTLTTEILICSHCGEIRKVTY